MAPDALTSLQVFERKQFSVACVLQQSECGVRKIPWPTTRISSLTSLPFNCACSEHGAAKSTGATSSRSATRAAPPNHGRIHRRAGHTVSLASLCGKTTWRTPDRGRRGGDSNTEAPNRKEGHVSLNKATPERTLAAANVELDLIRKCLLACHYGRIDHTGGKEANCRGACGGKAGAHPVRPLTNLQAVCSAAFSASNPP